MTRRLFAVLLLSVSMVTYSSSFACVHPILSALNAFKHLFLAWVRPGTRDPNTDLDGMKPVASPDGSPAEATRVVPDAGHAEAVVFEGIAYHERISGYLNSMRSCETMWLLKDNQTCACHQADGKKHRRKRMAGFRDVFNGAYDCFVEKLRDLFPGLTRNERRLCLFLRRDKTTKGISILTGQCKRAVELGRMRLRKKLNLTHAESDLNDFLSTLLLLVLPIHSDFLTEVSRLLAAFRS